MVNERLTEQFQPKRVRNSTALPPIPGRPKNSTRYLVDRLKNLAKEPRYKLC